MKRIETFKTSIPGVGTIPDPLKMLSTYEWYFLDSFSENLIRFDHLNGNYEPVLCEAWSIDGDEIHFKLRANLKFHDGSPLTAEDVLASFNRVVKEKISTHFEIWKKMKSIRIHGLNEVIITYEGDRQSLFMFLSSPEGSIWSKSDLEKKEFSPTKFSGFYYPTTYQDKIRHLEQNPHSVRKHLFPKAPSRLEMHEVPRKDKVSRVEDRSLDAVILDYTPFDPLFSQMKHSKVSVTVPVCFVHLLNLKPKSTPRLNQDFLKKMWALKDESPFLTPSYSIVPPGVEAQLTEAETLTYFENVRHPQTKEPVTIGIFKPYFSDAFQKAIELAAQESQTAIQIVTLDRDQFFNFISEPHTSNLDYILTPYLASDKFSLMQIKLILGENKVPFDFYAPNLNPEETIELGKEIQRYILKNQIIVPFFYVPLMTIYRDDIDLGNQPTTDGEIQFWRINENLNP